MKLIIIILIFICIIAIGVSWYIYSHYKKPWLILTPARVGEGRRHLRFSSFSKAARYMELKTGHRPKLENFSKGLMYSCVDVNSKIYSPYVMLKI